MISRSFVSILAGGTLLVALPAPPAQAQEPQPQGAASQAAPAILKGIGNLQYQVSTSSAEAQRFFNQGLSLAYAFNHEEAKRSFAEAARLDPACAMCYWGVAYVLGPNINLPMDPSLNVEANEAAQKALALSSVATPREQALIRAMAARYSSNAAAVRARLDSAYWREMQAVAQAHPEDPNALALFAEATMNLSPWDYWSRDKRPREGTLRAVAALERAMQLDRNHPGACHFYIHAVEAAYPERAVECAERLAALMPGAGHLVHMPAHIYIRVGRYADAIEANKHAVHADESYIADRGAGGFYPLAYYPHNHHFLGFAATLAARSALAIEAARAASKNTPGEVAAQVMELQPLVAYPLLTLTTFGRWDEILESPLPPADQSFARAMGWWARGFAHAGKGDLSGGAAALDSLAGTGRSITADPFATVLRIASATLGGELARRRGDLTTAVSQFTRGAQLEDELNYTEPPHWHHPVRHLLGAVLLEAGRPAEAERVYRQDLERFPENVWALAGLERALSAQSKNEEAGSVKDRLSRAAAEADVKLTGSRF
jgi:tetratricopeptide (TPR) repeat protein